MVIISNMATISLVLYYKDRIRRLRVIIDNHGIPLSPNDDLNQKDIDRYNILFSKIEQAMEEKNTLKTQTLIYLIFVHI
jgi:hypothetical protein